MEASMGTRYVCATALLIGVFAGPTANAQPIAADRLSAIMIAGNGSQEAIPLAEERLTVEVDGQHATTTLLQVYQHNNGSQIEGRYSLRPGMNSHVEGFAYWNGEQKIIGEVFERATARQVYDNVTARRRDPALLEQDGEGAFAFKVFPINPNEKKRIELRWTKWLERRGQTVKYRAPITRGDAEIVVDVVGAVKNIRSSTHKLRIDRTAAGVRLRSDGSTTSAKLARAAVMSVTSKLRTTFDLSGTLRYVRIACLMPSSPPAIARIRSIVKPTVSAPEPGGGSRI